MKYTEPKCEKSEAPTPPVTANFAPPPVEQPTALAPADAADEDDDVSKGPPGQAGRSQA